MFCCFLTCFRRGLAEEEAEEEEAVTYSVCKERLVLRYRTEYDVCCAAFTPETHPGAQDIYMSGPCNVQHAANKERGRPYRLGARIRSTDVGQRVPDPELCPDWPGTCEGATDCGTSGQDSDQICVVLEARQI